MVCKSQLCLLGYPALQIVFAKICGWAYGFMITIAPVKKGMELLYDYGGSYCESPSQLTSLRRIITATFTLLTGDCSTTTASSRDEQSSRRSAHIQLPAVCTLSEALPSEQLETNPTR